MPKDKNKVPHYKTDSLTTTTKKEIEIDPCVKFVSDSWEEWENFWANKRNEFEKYYDRWIGKPPRRDEDWQSAFHKRLTWQAEKVLVSRFHSALFPTSAPIDTEAVEVQDELQRILAKSIVAHWFKIGLVSKEFLSTMRTGAIYGTGMFEDDWYVRKENVTEKVERQIPDYRSLVDVNGQRVLDEQGSIKVEQIGTKTIAQEEKRLKVVEDRYRVRKANIFSWLIHPNKLDDDDDYPVIKQEFITYDNLLERQAESEKYGFGGFDNMDLIKKDKFQVKEEDVNRLQKDGDYIDIKNPRLEILSYWGLYSDSEKDKKRPMWIRVVNRKYILKKLDNPYWHQKPPLFHIVWTEDEKPSYYGIGLAQIGGDAEDRANLTVNIRTDVKKKNVRGTGWYNALDKKIKKSQLTSNVPGLMRSCSDINAASRYDIPPSLSPEDYKEEETAVNDHREITGATTSLLPTANVSEQHKTLGGMELLAGQASQRLKPDLAMMELMGIRKIANRAFLLTRQFMTQPETIELIASESQLKQLGVSKIYKMTPKEILGSVHFFCTGLSESLDKLQNIDKLMKYAEITSKVPAMQQITNYQAIAKRIALWLGFEDVESFIQMAPMSMPMAPQIGGNQPQLPVTAPNLPQGIPTIIPQSPQGVPQGAPQQGQGIPPQVLQALLQAAVKRNIMQGQPNQGGMV